MKTCEYTQTYMYIYIYPPAPCGPPGCEGYCFNQVSLRKSISSIWHVCKFTTLQSVSIFCEFTSLRPFNHFNLMSLEYYSFIACILQPEWYC